MTAASSPTRRPVPKVVAAGLGGALATIVLWALTATTGVEVPPEVAAAVAALASFGAGYLRRPGGALYDDADAAGHLDDPDDDPGGPKPAYAGGYALLGAIGLVLIVTAAVLTVTTLLGVLVVGWFALVATLLIGLVLLLLDGSTPA